MSSSESADMQYDDGLPATPNVNYVPTGDLQWSTPKPIKYAALPTPIGGLLRSWLVLRWHLARSVFAVPLPFLTAAFDLKLGDLIITLPVSVAIIVVTVLQAKTRDVVGTGTAPSIALLLVFAFAVRNNAVLLTLTGISFERALQYHKIAAIVTIVLAGLHGLAYVLARYNSEEEDQASRALSGIVAFGALLLLFLLSLNVIRRKFFELFVRVHWVLFLVVIVFAVIHGAGLALVGVVPWLIDMLFRLAYRPQIYSRGSLLSGKKAATSEVPSEMVTGRRLGVVARDQVTVAALPGNIVRIQFPRVRKATGETFNYEAGQYAFLCIPTISSLQWHPFTISSSPHEPVVSFHIKALGDWTHKLMAAVAAEHGEDVGAAPFDLLVDGPYGSVSIDIESPTYQHFVLFSGGIGVTPMRSIVNYLHHDVQSNGRAALERVHFVWSVRDRDTIETMVGNRVLRPGEQLSSSYFPQLLASESAVFSSEIYITRGERDVEAAGIDQQLEKSLRYNCRPDIAATLRAIGEQATQSGKTRVAVLVCGPKQMVREVVNSSRALSSEVKVRFDVHSELFEF